jgi:mono/diheme cytochrome c family protein
MGFRRFVNVIEIVTFVVAVGFVVALFANEPSGGGGAARSGPGYDVYLANCARCHGQDGQGGVGPKLAGGAVVRSFPDLADQIRLVENGEGTMPSFKNRLSTAEIEDVVAYTRTGLK